MVPLVGCARKAEFTLHQPFAPPAQQNLKLAGDWAFRAATLDTERETYALAFPLPGAADGPRAFVVYFTAPRKTGKLAIASNDPQAVRGFMIQEVGALAGRCDFVAGTLEVRAVPLAPRLRKLLIQARTEDGAELEGQALVEDLPRAIQSFEREFSGDVASLSPPPTPEASESETNEAADKTAGG
jgi:hypothetical protein